MDPQTSNGSSNPAPEFSKPPNYPKCLFKLPWKTQSSLNKEKNKVNYIKYLLNCKCTNLPSLPPPRPPRPCPHLLRRLRFWGRGENITGSVRIGLELPDSSECTGAPLLLEGTSKQPEQPVMGAGLQGMQTDALSILTNQRIKLNGTQTNRNTMVTTHTQSRARTIQVWGQFSCNL